MKKVETNMQIDETKSTESGKKRKINYYKILEYSLPSLVTLFVFFLILVIKGVYPFGSNIIGYIDYTVGLVPTYTHLWDFIHGNSDFFYQPNLGGGSNIFASFVFNSLLNPFAWIIGIFPKSAIIHGIVLIIGLQLAVMALTAYIAFKRLFPNVNKYMIMAFCLMWVFSGWMLVHFTNIGWINLLTLLPLLFLSMKRVAEKNKIAWFVAILAYCLMLSYYISYMILVGMVVSIVIYVIVIAKDKKKVASSFAIGVVFAMLISLFALAPSLIASLSSYRMESGGSDEVMYHMFGAKLVILLFYPLPILLFAMLCKHYKEDKKNILTFILIIGVMMVGLVIERVNAMWHTGNYLSFPYRYSFLMIFAFIIAALYYLNKYDIKKDIKPTKDEKSNTILLATSLVCFAMLALAIFIMANYMHPYREVSWVGVGISILTAVAGIFAYVAAFRYKKQVINIAVVCAVCIVQVLFYGSAFFGSIDDRELSYVKDTYAINTSLMDEPYRIKDRDMLLFENYPLFLNYPSISTWIHISPGEQTVAYKKLGYNDTSGVMLADSGGTMFSDVLLGNKYVLSNEVLDSRLYTTLQTMEKQGRNRDNTHYLYELGISMPYIQTFPVGTNFTNIDGETPFEYQNSIYKTLYGKTEDIIKDYAFTLTKVEENVYDIEVQVTDFSNLYLYTPDNKNNIIINDLKDFKDNDKNIFLKNGIFDIGLYENEIVTFQIYSENIDELVIGGIDIQTLTDLCGGVNDKMTSYKVKGSTIEITINSATAGELAFIPSILLNDTTAKINGQRVDVKSAMEAFMIVELVAGENKIELTFKPKFLDLGTMVTLITLLVLGILFVVSFRFKILDNKIVIWIGTVLGCVIVAVIAFLVYIKPLALTVLDIF